MISDSKARDEIIRNVNRNYFVEAGAGSGKTTILVERMVSMVEQGFPVEKICTITFTKAAANEFYARFQKRLSERSRDEHKSSHHAGELVEQTEETKQRCQKALLNIDSCFMGTIDAFCNMILSEHPLEAGIPADSTITEEERILDRYLAEYSRITIADEYSGLQEKYLRFTELLSDPAYVFTTLLNEVKELKNVEFIYKKPENVSFEEKYRTDKRDLIKMFDKLLDNEGDLAYENESGSKKAWKELSYRRTILKEGNWDVDFPLVLDSLKAVRKLRVKFSDETEKLLGSSIARFQPHNNKNPKWYDLAENGFADIVDSMEDYQARFALDFVLECLHSMSSVLKREGQLSFFDYKLYLRDMLRKDAAGGHKLIEHIYNRHSYFLIDEFQDTDPMQAEIFFYLAAKEFDEDWRKCVPNEGSLFIVGDPKQSIYRFKNADVASFKSVRSLFDGVKGEVLNLTSNFRSTYTLHKWFNKVFESDLLKEDSEDQSRYERISNKDRDDGFATGIYKYANDFDDDTKGVLDIIRTLVDNPAILIGDGRRIQYKDIMLITVAKKELGKYATAFTENRIPFKVEGNIDFNECPSLKSLAAIYKAIVCPDNNFCIYEALISRVINMSPETAMAIKDDIKAVRRTGIFVSENDKVVKLRQLIDRYSGKTAVLTASALFAELIDELRIFEVAGNHNLEYVYYVLELIREQESTGQISSAYEAVKYLEQLLDGRLQLERCAALGKNHNKVHLANLHKVKGLESEVVILAGPKKRKGNNNPGKRVEYDGDNPKCYMFVSEKLKFNDINCKKEKEKASVEAERIRQLYVAATRAKRILVIGDSKNPWGELNKHVDEDFFSCFTLREATAAESESADATELYDRAESIINSDSVSLGKSFSVQRPSDISYEDFSDNPTAVSLKRNPELIGTLVHRLMELIVSSRRSINLDDVIAGLCRGIEDGDGYYSKILHVVAERINNGGYPQSNGSPQDILKELLAAEELYCEMPFSHKIDDKTIVSGIIDVLYRQGDHWHIVDYKTNADGDDLDERYKQQLQEYCRAVELQTGKRASARIYHIDIEV